MTQHRNSKLIPALLAGLAVGTAIWFLFSTDQGRETRDSLVDSLKDIGDTLKERAANEVNNLASKAGKLADNVQSKVKEY
ncbi:MAG: YtxH domain-containing protein [Sphingobacteriaceae bacterium]